MYHVGIDLTQERLEEWWGLASDRERFVWALQTETRVRAAKVQRNNCNRSFTLQTNYLFDLYVTPSTNYELTHYDASQISKRDVDLYQRKVNSSVLPTMHGREPNGEFDALTYPLDLKPARCSREHLLPPNLLFFEMMLEAYCGYPLHSYFHHTDPCMPRSAIMGGAIVAVFVSWNDVRHMKEWRELEYWLRSPSETNELSPTPLPYDSYDSIVERLQRKLQDYFYGSSSLFAAGDVDIFLQPSPLTRSLTDYLAQHGLEGGLWKHVAEYLGGFALCEGDVRRFSTALCENMIVPAFEGIGPLIYSATQRGLSFALATQDEEQRWLGRERWPRNTQLIMLNEQADLLGALFDFDISVVAFAYDGNQVRAAPRAVLSLLTNVQVVTPFVLAEKRNRQRIVKVKSCALVID
ncbi:hypothetical protein FisN_33Lh040 [Fistulifera solaris]|uniref:Uncharacterized protein n=1 Tax=Fistulifera solaris TaxID=1519565 RepID=A0A1Z5KB32_FISSO|nr:hypothetical protein FisN_33Lh040 [Fistulifera solaris]|eukprot:GAX23148.1 hypothetical protein FisN_33Lh040 [Fistulifera solaris]